MFIGIEESKSDRRTKIVHLRDMSRTLEWLNRAKGNPAKREVYEVQDGFSPSNNDILLLANPRKKLSKQARMAIIYRRNAVRRIEP